jgi:hypothetical protein
MSDELFGLVLEWRDPRIFFAIASRAMRVRLIDMECRMPFRHVPVADLESLPINLQPAIGIDRLLDELAALHPGWSR